MFTNERRKIDHALLASFIEYAIEGKVTILEHNRFLVNHYSDELMEAARRDCSKYLSGNSGMEDPEAKASLYVVARKLRETQV